MVPYNNTGTTANTWGDATPCGNDGFYEYAHSYAYATGGEPAIDLDERKNPKMWALWFREFLRLIYPKRELAVRDVKPVAGPPVQVHCRSGTIPIREWKMKNWIQALEV